MRIEGVGKKGAMGISTLKHKETIVLERINGSRKTGFGRKKYAKIVSLFLKTLNKILLFADPF